MEQMQKWRVAHPDHGEKIVEAPDRLRALTTATKAWGVPWTPIARACTIEKLEDGHGD